MTAPTVEKWFLNQMAVREIFARRLRSMFGLDYRSLALLRIGLAVVLLCDLFASAGNLRVFYSDDGVLTRTRLLESYGAVSSFHMASGSVWFQAGLFALQAALALSMLAGYRTRVVTIASYVLFVSLQDRNPMLVFGAGIALRVCLFWAMFLPLNRCWSLDAAVGRAPADANGRYSRLPALAYLIQFSLIYIFSGLLKTGPTWQSDRTAVYYALSLEVFRRPLGAWLNEYDALTAWLTAVIPPIEIYGPLLLVLPFWNGWGRIVICAVFAILQIGINISMWMGLFGPVMIAVMLGLLPAEFWTHFVAPLRRLLVRALTPFKLKIEATGRRRTTTWARGWIERRRLATAALQNGAPEWRRSRRVLVGLAEAATVPLIVYTTFWNMDTIPGRQALIPGNYRWIGETIGLDQKFNLFAPDPQTDDGWIVIEGELESGETVNPLTGNRPVSYDRPAYVPASYIDQRWSSYLICFWDSACSHHLALFASYLERQWNSTHSHGERLRSINITFMHEVVGPSHTRGPLMQEVLWTQSFW